MTRLLLLMAKCDALAPLVGVSRVWRGVARGAASAARAARAACATAACAAEVQLKRLKGGSDKDK